MTATATVADEKLHTLHRDLWIAGSWIEHQKRAGEITEQVWERFHRAMRAVQNHRPFGAVPTDDEQRNSLHTALWVAGSWVEHQKRQGEVTEQVWTSFHRAMRAVQNYRA
jgi:hypothetical protein